MKSLSTEAEPPISADLAQIALWLRERADTGVTLDPLAVTFIAEAIDQTAMNVREMEQQLRGGQLRGGHVDAVADALADPCGPAIDAGVAMGNVVDFRFILAREMAKRGRPVPPHLLTDDDGDAA